MGYKKIAGYKNMPVSTVEGGVKRYRMQGNVCVTPHPGRPTKCTPEVQQRVEAAVEAKSMGISARDN